MLFNSYAFILLYLPLVLLGYYQLGRRDHRLAAAWLAASSLFFYGYWNPAYIGLLLGSIVGNYTFGWWIAKAGVRNDDAGRKRLLTAAVAANLLLLGYYKYANFFLGSVDAVAGTHWSLGEIMLPLGISFFTFTQIAFLVDTYQGKVKEYNFIHYLLFVTYFPHLIAGPILHHKQMMPQFANSATYRINLEHIAVGLSVFVLGLAKKVLIADNLAVHATPVFEAVSAGQTLSMLEAWCGSLAYTLQLYFDFSGYSDMAIGLSLLFNVRLPLNFDSPYKATSIVDFWRRWHMTLSAFLRDYLYIPLGGNRKGSKRRYANLMITMLLGGLWHGAGWTFVVWGGLHGFYLLVNHAWRNFKERMGMAKEGGKWSRFGARAITFLAVVVAWVFFRADSFSSAWSMLTSMAGVHHLMALHWAPSRDALKMILPGLILVWAFPNVRQIMAAYRPNWNDWAHAQTKAQVHALAAQSTPVTRLAWKPTIPHALLMAALFLYCLDDLSKVSEFLYFRF